MFHVQLLAFIHSSLLIISVLFISFLVGLGFIFNFIFFKHFQQKRKKKPDIYILGLCQQKTLTKIVCTLNFPPYVRNIILQLDNHIEERQAVVFKPLVLFCQLANAWITHRYNRVAMIQMFHVQLHAFINSSLLIIHVPFISFLGGWHSLLLLIDHYIFNIKQMYVFQTNACR